jgi:hypothetical protein
MSAEFSIQEKTNLLFKNLVGKPSTVDERSFFEEPNRPARPIVIPKLQIWSDDIPDIVPNELSILTDTSLDDNGNYMAGSLAGKTSGVIKRYIKIPLTMVIGTAGKAYEAPNSTVSHPNNNESGPATGTGASGTFNRVSQDIMPFNHDPLGSYLYNLYRSDGTEISFGFGEWNIDNASGLVTFYEYSDISLEVTEILPPLLSFYRYIGSKGIGNGSGSITGGITIFDSGNENSIGDDLAAIQISDICPTGIGTTGYTDALQFGSTCDGAIRLAVRGGNGTATNTALVVQRRISGEWVTIFKVG